jgi:hypothetical protein
MVKLILDFPWSIDEALEADPRPLQAIEDFLNFFSQLAHLGLEPVRFIYQQEQEVFWPLLATRRSGAHAIILRFLNHVAVQAAGGPYRAIPTPGPNDLRPTWQVALRDEMADLNNWRTPQIIVCAERWAQWERFVHDSEAAIALEDRPGDGVHHRVVVVMQSYDHKQAYQYYEDYRGHKHALADLDPWDLRRIHPSMADRRVDHPCRLAKPPELEGLPLYKLNSEIDVARGRGWQRHDRFYYIPPGHWRLTQVQGKAEWRAGVFPTDRAANGRGPGPIDYLGQVWDWDENERHWDVQLRNGTYKRITHEGVWQR